MWNPKCDDDYEWTFGQHLLLAFVGGAAAPLVQYTYKWLRARKRDEERRIRAMLLAEEHSPEKSEGQ